MLEIASGNIAFKTRKNFFRKSFIFKLFLKVRFDHFKSEFFYFFILPNESAFCLTHLFRY
jgi:hypothetical protein